METNAKENLGKRAISRIFKNLGLLILELLIIIVVMVIIAKSKGSQMKPALIIGIVAQLIYAFLILFSKKLRSPLTIWWAILAFLTVGWWGYLLIK